MCQRVFHGLYLCLVSVCIYMNILYLSDKKLSGLALIIEWGRIQSSYFSFLTNVKFIQSEFHLTQESTTVKKGCFEELYRGELKYYQFLEPEVAGVILVNYWEFL